MLIQPGGDEFKDDDMLLATNHVDWFAGVFARKGRRLMPDEVRVMILRPSEDRKSCVEEGELVLSNSETAADVASRYLSMELVSHNRARVRHMVKRSRPGTICVLGDAVRTSLGFHLVDGCELLVQELVDPETYEKGDVGIILREWQQSASKLAQPTELFVKQSWDMEELRKQVHARASTRSASTEVAEADLGGVQVVRPWAYQLKDVSTFNFCNWLQPGFRKAPPATDAVADPSICGKWTLSPGDVLVWRVASESAPGDASDAVPLGGKEVGIRIRMS